VFRRHTAKLLSRTCQLVAKCSRVPAVAVIHHSQRTLLPCQLITQQQQPLVVHPRNIAIRFVFLVWPVYICWCSFTPAPVSAVLLLPRSVQFYPCPGQCSFTPAPVSAVLPLPRSMQFYPCPSQCSFTPAPVSAVLLLPRSVQFYSCPGQSKTGCRVGARAPHQQRSSHQTLAIQIRVF